jgi:hypothetical protein
MPETAIRYQVPFATDERGHCPDAEARYELPACSSESYQNETVEYTYLLQTAFSEYVLPLPSMAIIQLLGSYPLQWLLLDVFDKRRGWSN